MAIRTKRGAVRRYNAIREMEVADDYADYQRLVEAGTLSGRLFKGDDGKWYFYLGL